MSEPICVADVQAHFGSAAGATDMTGSTPPSQRPATRREAILIAAIETFAARGYDGASVREIAERVGIAKGNLTYHFAVKEELLFAIMDKLHEDFLQLAQGWPALESDDLDDVLRTAFRQHALLVATRIDEGRIFYEAFRHLNTSQRAILMKKRNGYERAARILISRCRPDLGAPNGLAIKLRSRTVLGLLSWQYHWYNPAGPVEPQALAELVANMAIGALQA